MTIVKVRKTFVDTSRETTFFRVLERYDMVSFYYYELFNSKPRSNFVTTLFTSWKPCFCLDIPYSILVNNKYFIDCKHTVFIVTKECDIQDNQGVVSTQPRRGWVEGEVVLQLWESQDPKSKVNENILQANYANK